MRNIKVTGKRETAFAMPDETGIEQSPEVNVKQSREVKLVLSARSEAGYKQFRKMKIKKGRNEDTLLSVEAWKEKWLEQGYVIVWPVTPEEESFYEARLADFLKCFLLMEKRDPKKLLDDLQKRYDGLQERCEKAEDHRSTIVNVLSPFVDTFKRATLVATPPSERQWWQNLRAVYDAQSGLTNAEKWRKVAHRVILGAIEESRKLERERRSDYLTPRMLGTLIAKWKTPGLDKFTFEAKYAENLSHYVTREEKKATNHAKT